MSWKLTDLHAVMSLHKTVRVEERLVATLMIRDLDDDVKARLRVQAAEHGRSMEAEARLLLAAALSGRRPPRGLGSYIREQFAEIGGADLETPRPNEPARAAHFSA
ncbi:toxin-antitoxin system [Arthrobacter sp. H5]|uniref:FitA-like ribbon-helix-helix domain-containing protein n=1 Tax=Arthrobacter sp. H5 TaxID=1267973 RepID=UPI0004AFEBCB|nr:toxin-antitoxin system [Arthrobacter sp. H5]